MENYSTMVRGWGGLVSWGGLVCRSGLVSRSGCCISTVLNISNVSVVSINSVSYSLGTAVREENVVFSIGYSAISANVMRIFEVDIRFENKMVDMIPKFGTSKKSGTWTLVKSLIFTWIHFDQS